MDVETLRKYRRQEPFQPLRFHFSEGDPIEVRHPQLLLVTEKMIMVGIPSPDHPELPDVYKKFKWVRPDHIVRVEILAEPSTVL
jgi:hypothetical protein